jgi:hypothetical protein
MSIQDQKPPNYQQKIKSQLMLILPHKFRCDNGKKNPKVGTGSYKVGIYKTNSSQAKHILHSNFMF